MTMCIYCGDRVGIVCDACASTAKERDELQSKLDTLTYQYDSLMESAKSNREELEVLKENHGQAISTKLEHGGYVVCVSQERWEEMLEQIQQLQSHKICLEEGEECVAVKLRDELDALKSTCHMGQRIQYDFCPSHDWHDFKEIDHICLVCSTEFRGASHRKVCRLCAEKDFKTTQVYEKQQEAKEDAYYDNLEENA